MEDLFRDYWWLLFPISWIVIAGFQALLAERRRDAALDLIRTYAEKGQTVPPELERVAYRREGC